MLPPLVTVLSDGNTVWLLDLIKHNLLQESRIFNVETQRCLKHPRLVATAGVRGIERIFDELLQADLHGCRGLGDHALVSSSMFIACCTMWSAERLQ